MLPDPMANLAKPPAPTYCECFHIRIKHRGGMKCLATGCGCQEFVAAEKQPPHPKKPR